MDSTLCDQQIVVLSLGVPCIRFNYVSKVPTAQEIFNCGRYLYKMNT